MIKTVKIVGTGQNLPKGIEFSVNEEIAAKFVANGSAVYSGDPIPAPKEDDVVKIPFHTQKKKVEGPKKNMK